MTRQLNPRPVAVVTGAAAGEGRACALALAKAGAELVLCDNDGPALHQIASLTGGSARFCDIASETSVEIFAADVLESFGNLRIVINAAGRGYVRALGMMRVCRGLLPGLRKGAGGKVIVNFAPRARLASDAGLFPHAASYDAFVRLSEAIALQTLGSSIETVTVVPTRGPKPQLHDPLPELSAGRLIELERLASDAIGSLVLDLADDALRLDEDELPQQPRRSSRG